MMSTRCRRTPKAAVWGAFLRCGNLVVDLSLAAYLERETREQDSGVAPERHQLHAACVLHETKDCWRAHLVRVVHRPFPGSVERRCGNTEPQPLTPPFNEALGHSPVGLPRGKMRR